jgi:hypothetical protein
VQSWLIRIIILACTAVHLLGCAERTRYADAGRTASEIEGFYETDLRGKTPTVGNGIAAADDMVDDPSTNMYYAESYRDPGGTVAPMGPVDAVTPIQFDKLGLGINQSQIQTIRVYFFDQIGGDGRYNHALVMHITTTGSSSQPLILALANNSSSDEMSSVDDDGVFQVSFSLGGNQRLLLESNDTTDGELNEVVQFKLFLANDGEEPEEIGQISSMIGFLSKN